MVLKTEAARRGEVKRFYYFEPFKSYLRKLDFSLLGLFWLIGIAIFSRIIDPRLLNELGPWPDTTEYVTSARNILEKGKFVVSINGIDLPSRYSFGFPLLIEPVYLLLGVKFTNAIFSVLALDLLQIGLVYWLGRRIYGKWAGLFSVSILVLSPIDTVASQQILSDLPSTTFVIISVLALTFLKAPEDRQSGFNKVWPGRDWTVLVISGGFFGLSCWIRQINLLLLPVFFLYVFLVYKSKSWPVRELLSKAFGAIFLLTVSFLLVELPILLFNIRTFGGLTRTGYNLWVSYWYDDLSKTFSINYAFGANPKLVDYLRALIGEPGPFLAKKLAFYSPVICILAIIAVIFVLYGFLRGRRWVLFNKESDEKVSERKVLVKLESPFVTLALGIIFITYLTYSFYFYSVDLRFVHLCLPFVSILAGGGVKYVFGLIRKIFTQRRFYPKVEKVIFGAVVIFIGWQLGLLITQSVWWKTQVQAQDLYRASSFETMQLVEEKTEPDALIISDNFAAIFFSAYQQYDSERKYMHFKDNELVPSYFYFPNFINQFDIITDLISKGKGVYYIGDPDEFKRLPFAQRFNLKLAGTKVNFNGYYELMLYRIALQV